MTKILPAAHEKRDLQILGDIKLLARLKTIGPYCSTRDTHIPETTGTMWHTSFIRPRRIAWKIRNEKDDYSLCSSQMFLSTNSMLKRHKKLIGNIVCKNKTNNKKKNYPEYILNHQRSKYINICTCMHIVPSCLDHISKAFSDTSILFYIRNQPLWLKYM